MPLIGEGVRGDGRALAEVHGGCPSSFLGCPRGAALASVLWPRKHPKTRQTRLVDGVEAAPNTV